MTEECLAHSPPGVSAVRGKGKALGKPDAAPSRRLHIRAHMLLVERANVDVFDHFGYGRYLSAVKDAASRDLQGVVAAIGGDAAAQPMGTAAALREKSEPEPLEQGGRSWALSPRIVSRRRHRRS